MARKENSFEGFKALGALDGFGRFDLFLVFLKGMDALRLFEAFFLKNFQGAFEAIVDFLKLFVALCGV